MNAIDHSVLVFLLDCIEVAPNKSADLLALAGKRIGASEDFQREIRWLSRALLIDKKIFMVSVNDLRERLRSTSAFVPTKF